MWNGSRLGGGRTINDTVKSPGKSNAAGSSNTKWRSPSAENTFSETFWQSKGKMKLRHSPNWKCLGSGEVTKCAPLIVPTLPVLATSLHSPVPGR